MLDVECDSDLYFRGSLERLLFSCQVLITDGDIRITMKKGLCS